MDLDKNDDENNAQQHFVELYKIKLLLPVHKAIYYITPDFLSAYLDLYYCHRHFHLI